MNKYIVIFGGIVLIISSVIATTYVESQNSKRSIAIKATAPRTQPTNSPTPTIEPTATLIPTVNPYKTTLNTQLTSRLTEINQEIEKWNEAISYDQSSAKSVMDQAQSSLNNPSNGVYISSSEIMTPAMQYANEMSNKIAYARNQIDLLNEEKTQILIQLSQ